MRDEKEGKQKQARSNKQGKATQHTQGSHVLAGPHLVQNELAGVRPAVVSHEEGDGGRGAAVAVDVVEALREAVSVEVAVLRVLVVERHAAHHDAGPIISMLCSVYIHVHACTFTCLDER